MFHLILTACLATSSADCRPILLPAGDGLTRQECLAEAERISQDWVTAHPDLTSTGTACVASDEVAALEMHAIAPGIWLRQGAIAQSDAENRGRIANLSVIIGETGVAVIDTGGSRAEGQELYAAVKRLTNKPVSHVILTHMHPDHVLGASVFAEAGAQIVANDRLVQSLQNRAQTYLDNMNRIIGPDEMIGTGIAMPNQIVSNQAQIDLGGRILTLMSVPTAHTDNDLTIRDSATNTYFAGDLVFRELTPIVDGSLTGWLDWLSVPPSDVGLVVPGHGPVSQGWQEAVAKQQGLLLKLHDSVRSAIDSGLPISEAVPKIVAQLQYVAEGWVEFDQAIARDATTAFKELEWE